MGNMNIQQQEKKLYRETAGIILQFKDQILLCKTILGHWAMPQGGIKSYETPLEAAKRELKEEVDVDSNLGQWSEASPWMILILPPENRKSRRYRRFIGQKYIWFVCKCEEKPNIFLNTKEFKPRFMWCSPEKIIKLSGAKCRIYVEAFKHFKFIN